MNPGLDYEKLKQESDEIDGLKGKRIFTFLTSVKCPEVFG